MMMMIFDIVHDNDNNDDENTIAFVHVVDDDLDQEEIP